MAWLLTGLSDESVTTPFPPIILAVAATLASLVDRI